MLGLGSVGNIGGLIGAVIALGIMAIVLLTFAPTVAGDVNGIFLEGKDTCVIQGERFDQVVEQPSGVDNADDAWYEGTTIIKLSPKTGGGCISGTVTGLTGPKTFYTPKGTKIDAAAADIASNVLTVPSGKWKTASKSVGALAGGSLALLLLGAMAILIPAGALGFLA